MAKVPLAQRVWLVYWLYDKQCVCYLRHGYIGRTSNWERRLIKHRFHRRFPSGFKWMFLFQGTRAECKQLEWEMRPHALIGWNIAPGGGGGYGSRGRLGQKKSKEECKKISTTRLERKLNWSHIHATGYWSKRLKGGPGLHAGHLHSDETKEIIRQKKAGVSVHTGEHKRKLSERWKGNSLTKSKPWSAARRLAWLENKEA